MMQALRLVSQSPWSTCTLVVLIIIHSGYHHHHHHHHHCHHDAGAVELVAGSSPYVTYPALTLGTLLLLPGELPPGIDP